LVAYSEPTAPDGATNGVTYESFTWDNGFTNCVKYGNASNIYHYFNYTLLDATTYTLSFFVQMDDGSEPQIGNGVGNDFRIELADASNYGLNITKTLVTGNVWKITKTETTVVGRNFNGVRKIFNSSKGFRITGYQLEALSYATSYIPTNGATNTRLQDLATNSGNASLINSTEGVLYAEIAANANSSTNRTISINNGSSTDSLLFRYRVNNQFQIIFRSGNNNIVNEVFDLSNNLDFNKIAFSYKLNEFKIFVNGLQIGSTITSGVVFGTTINSLDFEQYNGLDKFYGKVKALAVYKEALTDAELQSLTTI
jgi:hypothetical protein